MKFVDSKLKALILFTVPADAALMCKEVCVGGVEREVCSQTMALHGTGALRRASCVPAFQRSAEGLEAITLNLGPWVADIG